MNGIAGKLRRAQVLDAIKAHIAEFGYPPTVREIGELVSLRSKSAVQHHLDALEAEGKIKRRRGSNRAITVVGDK